MASQLLEIDSNSIEIIVSQDGVKGEAGDDGLNGTGLNQIRKSLVDDPLCWAFAPNQMAKKGQGAITWLRPSEKTYTDRYGNSKTAAENEPMQNQNGWRIVNDENVTFPMFNNVPRLDQDFSFVIEMLDLIGKPYSQIIAFDNGSADSDTMPGIYTQQVAGEELVFSYSDGVNTVSVTAPYTVNAFVKLAYVFKVDVGLTAYVDGVAVGTIGVANLSPVAENGTAYVGRIASGITANMVGFVRNLRTYDFALSADEVSYLHEGGA